MRRHFSNCHTVKCAARAGGCLGVSPFSAGVSRHFSQIKNNLCKHIMHIFAFNQFLFLFCLVCKSFSCHSIFFPPQCKLDGCITYFTKFASRCIDSKFLPFFCNENLRLFHFDIVIIKCNRVEWHL